jgi:hypothetical protein
MGPVPGWRGASGRGLLFDGGGLAFLDVVFVPGGDLGDVGAGLFDDALAAEAGVELEAGGHVEAIELEVFGLGDAFGTLLEEHVAGGAGGDATAGVVHEDAVVFGDVEEAHGLAVAVVGHGVVDEFDGLIFRLEGDANDVCSRRLGEVDFGERSAFVIRHDFSSLVHGTASTHDSMEWPRSFYPWKAWIRAEHKLSVGEEGQPRRGAHRVHPRRCLCRVP